MEKAVSKKFLMIGIGVVILLAGIIGYWYYQKEYGWNSYEVVEVAGEKFIEQRAFAYTKTVTQKTKTPNKEVLNGGIREIYKVQFANDQSLVVDYTDGLLEVDNKFRELDKVKFYLSSNNKNYTDNLGYYFKASDLRFNQYELPKVLNFITNEFALAQKGENKDVQEILEAKEKNEYVITYKTRLNEMSEAVSEYEIYVNEKTGEFSKLIIKEYFEGYEVVEEFTIVQDYVAADTIEIPETAEEILQ